MSLFAKILKKICNKICSGVEDSPKKYEMKDIYCHRLPSAQTMADIFKGEWYSSLPARYGVKAGEINHFDFEVDPRVQWTNDNLEHGLKGLSVLELGPYEAYNTWQLEQLGAGDITAIENNKISFLKCLVVKEITGLKASFLHGDFISYLEHCTKIHKTFDILWASGVLYHQSQPLKLLDLISKVTGKVFIHTHYYDEKMIAANPDLKSYFIPNKNETRDFMGKKLELFYKSYKGSNRAAMFSGGSLEYSYWLKKDDIFSLLKGLGFGKITVEVDTPGHDNGPGICFLAEKN